MTRYCPKCGEPVPSNSLTCPKCYTKIPPEPAKTEKKSGGTDAKGKSNTIRMILSIVPGFFGILGLGQIYRNYKQKRGYVFLLLGLFFAIGAITLLLFPIPEFFVSVFKTIAGIGMGFIYAILFLLSVLDSLASTSIVVR